MWIDVHVHNVFTAPDRWSMISAIIATARRIGVTHLCLLGDVLHHGYYPSPTQVREINSFTIDCLRRYPSLFTGFCFLNPQHNHRFIREETERCIVQNGFKGIKLEVAVNCRDRRLVPVMQRALELNVPVLCHAWYKTVGQTRHESTPADVAYLAKQFPQVRVIMAHLGAAGRRGILDIRPCPNVYVDTSGSHPTTGLLEYAASILGAHRILYGSDVPGRDFAAQIGRILGAGISAKHKDLILGANARALLHLGESHV